MITLIRVRRVTTMTLYAEILEDKKNIVGYMHREGNIVYLEHKHKQNTYIRYTLIKDIWVNEDVTAGGVFYPTHWIPIYPETRVVLNLN